MRFVLEIDCNNAAFDEDPRLEVMRLLVGVVEKVGDGALSLPLVDTNGNYVGRAEFRAEAPDAP